MSAFRVGQRVRIARNVNPNGWGASVLNRLIGLESVVAGFTHEAVETGHTILLAGLPRYRFHPADLEPIVDDGRKVIEWSECLWQPEGIAA